MPPKSAALHNLLGIARSSSPEKVWDVRTPTPPFRFTKPLPARRLRVALADGRKTTVHVAAYPLATTEVRLAVFEKAEPLLSWCQRHNVAEAIVGGFFWRPDCQPLGEVWVRGQRIKSTAFVDPWQNVRGCVYAAGRQLEIAPRSELPQRPHGDLLQAGPQLVKNGCSLIRPGQDPEGFSAAAHQFDSDITAGRYPRAALGIGNGLVLAVAADGRAPGDAGLTLSELAEVLARLGADAAINLDGGASTTLVSEGRIANVPREGTGATVAEGRPIYTALTFLPKG